jgi:hypothetical protein
MAFLASGSLLPVAADDSLHRSKTESSPSGEELGVDRSPAPRVLLGFRADRLPFRSPAPLAFPVTVVRQPGFVALLVDVAFEVGYLYSLKKRAGFRHLVTAFLVSRYVMIASFLAGGAMFWLFQPAP